MKKLIAAITIAPFIVVGGSAAATQCPTKHIANPGVLETIKCLVDEKVNEKLSNAIVMTWQDCSTFGKRWTKYEPMNGRFPIASGSGTDERQGREVFTLGTQGGEYKHQLRLNEMPEHTHSYMDKYLNNVESENAERGDDDDEERRYNNDRRPTGVSGENDPHNNMPPYSVVNFCWQGNDQN